jgi:hypothetical protein
MNKPLFILSTADDPHRAHPHRPTIAVCGVPLKGAIVITEAQALVYLADRRCQGCEPHHRHPHARRREVLPPALVRVRRSAPNGTEQPNSVRNSVLRWAAA